MEDPKDIEQPQGHADDHDSVEDRLDGSLHGDETIDEPKKHAYNDESDNNLNEWNGTLALLFRLERAGRSPDCDSRLPGCL
jgi:hypothetical protein